jgi:hypothetical protein
MKTFEEKYCAWIDEQLAGDELAAFEAEMRREGMDPGLERRAALGLGSLLRGHGRAPELANADFFNSQILREIMAEQPRAREAAPATGLFGWSLARMAWVGASLVALAIALFQFTVPRTPPASGPDYVAEVLNTSPGEGVSATAFHSVRENVTVLWLDGVEYIPDDKALAH